MGLLALRLCLGQGPFPLCNSIPIHQMTPCPQHSFHTDSSPFHTKHVHCHHDAICHQLGGQPTT